MTEPGTGPVPVTEPGTGPVPVQVPDLTGGSGTGSGTGAKFSSGRVLVWTDFKNTV